MSNAPVYEIDPTAFWNNPYPDLQILRETKPVAYVPQLNATLITRRDDIFKNEKIIEVFSSVQPDGLMTKLMGQNLMRKDGEDHMAERKAIFPTMSPKTAKTVWKAKFADMTRAVMDDVEGSGEADLVHDVAKRISGEALKIITGLTNMTWQEMDQVSQGMVDGVANYSNDPEVEAHCRACTKTVEDRIDELVPVYEASPDHSLLSVHLQADMSKEQYYANVKLAISGGQNEVRDVMAGLAWAMLTHPEQLKLIQDGSHTWFDATEEFTRWMSPVGMSPRRVAERYELNGVTLEPDDRVFFMFGSGCRDASVFERPDIFDMTQDASASIAFGAGPHFCAGAWASRCLLSDVAMPMLFDRLRNLRLAGEAVFGGWAFRGPLNMPVIWDAS